MNFEIQSTLHFKFSCAFPPSCYNSVMKCAPFPPSRSRASFLRFALHGCLLLATLAGANAADAKYSVQIALRSALTPPILLEVTGAEGGRAQNLVTKDVV